MSTFEGLVLDALDLNDATNYGLEMLDMPSPPRLAEWVRGSDSDGSLLAKEPPADNREITARLWVAPQATMDLAMAKVGAVIDKLQEAARNPAGINLVWTPNNGTIPLTFHVLFGEVTELPLGWESGYMSLAPAFTVRMVCEPYGYGAEVVGAVSSFSLPVGTVELTGVTGDVPALGRCIVSDNASQARRLVRVGLESRYFPTASPPVLLLDSDALVTSGFAGVQATRAGAYDPDATGNNVVRGTLVAPPTAVCGTGNLTNVGTFRVFARVYVAAAATRTVFVRLAWSDGDGPLRANAYASPPVVNGWAEVDLGSVTVTEKTLGSQRWTGRVEAFSTVAGETVDLDYAYLMPTFETYAEARAADSPRVGVLTAHAAFSHGLGLALNGLAATVGGTWATSGPASDFTTYTADRAYVYRSTASDASPRFAILGASSLTDTDLGVGFQFTDYASQSQVLIARWTNASNQLRVIMQAGVNIIITKNVAGVLANIAYSPPLPLLRYTWYRLRCVVYASGSGRAWVEDDGGVTLLSVAFFDAALATSGTLATGGFGIGDYNNGSVCQRSYSDFAASIPSAEPIVCYAAQSIEFRHDGVQREDATGTYWGSPPSSRGSRFLVPPAGTRARKSRVAVVARRNDVVVSADDQIADSTTVQVNWTPRFVNVPR